MRLIFLLLLLGAARAAVADTPWMRDIQAALPAWMEDADIPGVGLVLLDGGHRHAGGVGVRCEGDPAPVTDTTVFEAASLSKPVVAYAVLRLAATGELDLDAPLAEMTPLPRIDHDPRHRDLTPRMVLSHTTGLPNWGGDRLELAFDPGTDFRYSGEGYVALQHALVAHLQEDFDSLLERVVFGPLGMPDSSFRSDGVDDTQRACAHRAHGPPLPTRRFLRTLAPSSLLTTPRDFVRFLAAVLAHEGLPDPWWNTWVDAVHPMTDRGPAEAQSHIDWSLGWGLQTLEDGDRALWHWGDNGIARAFVWVEPTTERAFAYFTGTETGLAIAEDFLRTSGRAPWCLRMLRYRAREAPFFRTRRDVIRSVRAGGEGTLDRLPDLTGSLSSEPELLDIAAALRHAGEPTAAAALLSRAPFRSPESALALARAHREAGNLDQALAALVPHLNPREDTAVNRLESWLRAEADAPGGPPSAESRRLVGRYGPHQLALEDGGLVDHRQDTGAQRRLQPIAPGLYALEGQPWIRLEFQFDAGGNTVTLIERFAAGGSRRRPRDDGL